MKRLIAYLGILSSIILGGILGLTAALVWTFGVLKADLDIGYLPIGIALGAFIGGVLAFIRVRLYFKGQQIEKGLAKHLTNVPANAANLIRAIIGQMGYRKKVRDDVMAELIAHFEDELRDCKTDEEKEQKAQKLIEDFGDVKLLAVLLRRAKKRCRPLWRTVVARTFQTIGVLILCFTLYCIYISLGKPTIAINYVEEITRLARPVADDDLNAAPIYQKAFDAYKEPPLVKYETEISLLDAIKDKDWVTELTEEELALLKQWLSDNADTIEFYRRAAEKPHCWWKREAKDNFVLAVPMPELASLRNITKMMVWQSKLKAHEGYIEEAFDDLLTCYRAGRHLKGTRSLVEQLVGMAIQALSANNALVILHNQKIDHQLIGNLQIRFEKLMAEDTYIINYELERFLALDFMQRCYTDDGKGSGHMIPGKLKPIGGLVGEVEESAVFDYGRFLVMSIASANRREMSRVFEKIYSTAEEWATKTPWQLHKENVDFEMGFANWSFLKKARYWPVHLLTPALGKLNEIAYRNKVQVEALITTLAIIRFKQSTGNYPESLDNLVVTGYLKQLPLDPFSDKALIYKRTEDNFILYSVGPNFTDDGGWVCHNDEGRPMPWGDEGDAVFWPVEN
jgi:hypothetical protein